MSHASYCKWPIACQRVPGLAPTHFLSVRSEYLLTLQRKSNGGGDLSDM